MDANNTKFHLILRKDEWGECSLDEDGTQPFSTIWNASPAGNVSGIDWSQDQNEINLHSRIFQFIPAPNDKEPGLDSRRGAGCDRYGNWYWIAPDSTEILVNSTGGNTSRFWSPSDGSACKRTPEAGEFRPAEPAYGPSSSILRGLTITGDHFLVVGTVDPGGALIFDLYAGGPPRHILWPSQFAPFDMAAAPGGGLWILDRDNSCLWGLDRHFNILNLQETSAIRSDERGKEFQPVDGGKRAILERIVPNPASLAALSLFVAEDPIAIECLPDGSLLILDRKKERPFSSVLWYTVRNAANNGSQAGKIVYMNEVSLACVLERVDEEPGLQPGKERREFTLIAHDFVFVPEHTENDETIPDRLYVAEEKGNQSFAFNISQKEEELRLETLTDFSPMRLFGGKALAAAGSQVHYDFGDRWVPLVAQPRPRYVLEASIYTPLDGGVLDGKEPDCVWHRLMLDASLPPETEVEVWSRAANDKNDLLFTEWRREPDPYLRGDGCELPFAANAQSNRPTWETLFQQAKGRYLQIMLTLSGDGRTTPRIRAMRAYYPRFSYLNHYLPAAYREDETSASFLDRFLANFEGLSTALEDRIAAVQILFDPLSCPSEAVEWLGSWFGIALDPSWDEARRRMFLAHAMDFFQHRGTLHGLRMALHLAFDRCIDESIFKESSLSAAETAGKEPFRIVEQFRTRRTPALVLGDTSDLSGPRLVEPSSQWRPDQGRDNLLKKYAGVLTGGDSSSTLLPVFPIAMPEKEDEADAWKKFSKDTLGFVPAADKNDLQAWKDFLRLRYRRVSALNEVYGSSWKSFEEIPLPGELPHDGGPLGDWYQFQGVVLAMRRSAHRFRVLVPMPKTETPYSPEHARRLDLATRIINLEKPAHTVFDVKFYWSLFQVGAVRLGLDTVLDDLSSRGAGLTARMVLGSGHLGETYLSSELPGKLSDRNVPGCRHLNSKSAHA